MGQINRLVIENFLRKEGFKISSKVCSEEENRIYDCWIKGGSQKIRLNKGVKNFQFSQLSGIFQDSRLLNKFNSSLN